MFSRKETGERNALTSGREVVETPDIHSIQEKPMSMHRSLKGADKVAAKRNVLKRFERIEVLKGAGRWKEGDRGRGLPKTKPPV